MQLQNVTDIQNFMFAGKAFLTLASRKTGDHLTYKITKAEDGRVFFVSFLNGPDNTSHYAYMGIIRDCDKEFKHTVKSRAKEDAKVSKAFRWFLAQVVHNHKLPDELEVFHEGRCGRCGRKLTVPESIENGIGPECIKHMGG